MLSPRAVRLVLRHFDAIDQAISQRLTRKRPWGEEALTHLLCDLLDFETQQEEKVSYTIVQLLEDLAKSDEPLDIRLRIDTHQYPKHLETWVTQSDLGLIISFQDQFDAEQSTTTAWLLQAKRLFPSKNGAYETDSKFDSVNPAQEARMKALRDWAQEDFVKYILYCPRPKKLGPPVRAALNQLRTNPVRRSI
jgi:hypothetical protein